MSKFEHSVASRPVIAHTVVSLAANVHYHILVWRNMVDFSSAVFLCDTDAVDAEGAIQDSVTGRLFYCQDWYNAKIKEYDV